MASISFIEQLVDSMIEHVDNLELSIENKDFDQANKIKADIFDLYLQIKRSMGDKNV